MKYYKLIYDYENDEQFINCNIANIGVLDEYCTSRGIPIDEWGDYSFEYDSNEGNVVSDYVANVYRWLIVTNEFKNLVLSEVDEKNYQVLPVKLLDKIKNIYDINCYVVNILDILENALDLEHSKYDIFELDDEKILSVEKYAFFKSKVEGHDIFRLSEDTTPIFVSEKVKLLIENHELKGFRFLEVYIS